MSVRKQRTTDTFVPYNPILVEMLLDDDGNPMCASDSCGVCPMLESPRAGEGNVAFGRRMFDEILRREEKRAEGVTA